MDNATTTRNTQLAALFEEQELVIQGLLADIQFDSSSAYVEGHQEWLNDDHLRDYKERLEGLARLAKFAKEHHGLLARS